MQASSIPSQLFSATISQFVPILGLSMPPKDEGDAQKMDIEQTQPEDIKHGSQPFYPPEQHMDGCVSLNPPIVHADAVHSAALVTDEFATISSKTVCLLLSKHLPSLFSVGNQSLDDGAEMLHYSAAGIQMLEKIIHFFKFSRQYAKLTMAELIHTIALIYRLCQEEEKRILEGHKSIISEGNLGTLLLVAVLLAQKSQRDIPFRNSWWSKVFGIPIPILNQSEIVFLAKLQYSLNLQDVNYWHMYRLLTSQTST